MNKVYKLFGPRAFTLATFTLTSVGIFISTKQVFFTIAGVMALPLEYRADLMPMLYISLILHLASVISMLVALKSWRAWAYGEEIREALKRNSAILESIEQAQAEIRRRVDESGQ